MKKNFLMVASLLIAAMLLVVSCSQEVKAPENNLVEVKLSTTFGRDIDIKDGTDTSALSYKYTMVPNWNGWTTDKGTTGIGKEDITGIVSSETEVEKDKSLGWVTPGLWTVNVYAYDETNTKVFEGSNDVYFSNKNNKVTVYLKPADDDTNSLTFEIKMQDLAANGGSYLLKYSVVGTPYLENGVQKTTTVDGELEWSSFGNNVGKYTLKSDDTKLSALKSDYYRVTVSIYDGNTLLGGITKGVLLANGDNASVEGNIEPSDYINAQFDVKLFYVKTSLSKADVVYFSSADCTGEATSTNDTAKSAKAVITLTDSTDKTKYDANIGADDEEINVNCTWYVDGEIVATGSPNSENRTLSYEVKDTKPGCKNVSCQTVYSMTDADGVTYYWSDTQSIQVKFDGAMFAKNNI